jgi:shikimate kinase
MDLGMKANDRIILVGYRGTGKSTIGPLLANELGWQYADADVELEKAANQSIRDIFASIGEAGFRDLECKTLKTFQDQSKLVLATGGGVILREENRLILHQLGWVLWLQSPAEVIFERTQKDPTTAARRPNLIAGGLAEIQQLLQIREPMYREVANFQIQTNEVSPMAMVEPILAAWKSYWNSHPRSSDVSG